ncbi:hypothetical protein NPD12_3745 (plasmid) [Clostridium botulinum]|uniref:hypothetical protein n=1 Tax=Clostridium botulinum TaxID=1491 RepID=UPI000519BBE8|nr:hypothetical protein [Clostridium botulinum]APC82228.1 hypothetical protein NPD12_3745 [Clostridium botulinum]
MLKGDEGYYVIAEYKEPQEVGGKMIDMEVFQLKKEFSAVEYGKALKKLSYVERVSIAKAMYDL